MPMKQTGVRLDDEEKAAAIQRAKSLKRTFGSYLRNLIAEDLKKAGEAFEAAGDKVKEKSNELKERGRSKIDQSRGTK